MNKFFKIINSDNIVLSVVKNSSHLNYVKVNPSGYVVGCRSKEDIEKNSFGLSVNMNIYALDNPFMDYPICHIVEIDEDEYNYLEGLLYSDDTEEEEGSSLSATLVEEIPAESYENCKNSNDESVMITTKALKIKEMSSKCKKAITSGVDIIFPNKINEHFDLTIEDQLNLNSLRYKLNQGENYLIYHSKGGNFTYYTREEVQLIIETADKHILYHNAYFNSLKHYVNSLTDYIIASKIEYGQEIPELYKSEVLKSLEK